MKFRDRQHLRPLGNQPTLVNKLTGMILIILGLVVGLSLWRWWRVTQVICLADGQLLAEANCPAKKSLKYQPMLSLDLAKPKWLDLRVITDNQLQNWSLVSWSKKLPQSITLNYTFSPIQYNLAQAGQTVAVTSIGRTQPMTVGSNSANLTPMIFVASDWPKQLVTNGQIDSSFDIWAKKVFQTYFQANEPVPELYLIDEFTAKISWPSWELVITPLVDPMLELQRLKLVRATLAEKDELLGKTYRSLDVRFKLPVLIPVGSSATSFSAGSLSATKSATLVKPTLSATKSAATSASSLRPKLDD